MNGSKVLLTRETAKKYVGKTIHLYSPFGCIGVGKNNECLCEKCAGIQNSKYVGLNSNKVATVLTNLNMKKFHDSHFDFKYPAFANAYGKYYLKQSSFPYNDSYKTLTNNLLHYFGDAYLQIFSEVPKNISVTHPEELDAGSRSVTIFARAAALSASAASFLS